MDIFDAATYFDGLTVTDAYTDEELFVGQLEPYTGTERDTLTGWRRTCSAAVVSRPTRRAVSIGGDVYLAGMIIPEFFRDEKIREHLLLHPSDGLYTFGSAYAFLAEYSAGLTSFFGALSLRKEQKEESESSQFFNLYNIYAAPAEAVQRDQIVVSPSGIYFRVQNIELQTGEYQTLYVSDLGSGVLQDITYTPASGGYDVTTDTTVAGIPATIPAIVERYQTNYRYMTWAAEKYQNGDKIATISSLDVTTPETNDRIAIGGQGYRVLSKQSDGAGSWELHLRPAIFDLTVET